MKKISGLGFYLIALCFHVQAQSPQAQIHNKRLQLKIYLPDAQNGFYRGVRLDWSGVIADLEFSGHHLYVQYGSQRGTVNHAPAFLLYLFSPAEDLKWEVPLNKPGSNRTEEERKEMKRAKEFSKRCRRLARSLGTGLLLLAGFAGRAHAADYLDLPVVKPVLSCEQLGKIDVSQAAGAKVTIAAATVTDTSKGQFCKVTGNIEPTIGFEVDLPMEHWTQRYTQAGCGAYCGNVRVGINQSGSCMPALNGEFAVASNDLGHQGGMGTPEGEAAFGADPQKRIDFAYRANHETALVAKALIKAFYAQPQKFAYFAGCSDGGREALAEAQRFPEDFDGISAGSPVAILNVHNSFFHGWETAANKRADGSTILFRDRLSILHDAVIAHCAAQSGVDEGVLQEPRACKVDPAWAQCPAGATDTSKCLTAEEMRVVQKLYEGPSDAAGHRFEISGFPVGSEAQWNVPMSATSTSAGPGGGGGMTGQSLKYLLFPTVSEESPADLSSRFSFSEESFKKVSALAPLYNAANTNLRPFQRHGSKLILWHGGSDTSVPPAISIAYYQGVQKELGADLTDTFMRFFLLPGVGHCGGGDGPSQINVLTPLMAWTELHQAPKVLIAGKTENQQMGPGPGGPGRAGAGPGQPGQNRGGPPGGGNPYSQPAVKTLTTRPIYPYPYIAHYTGNGDPNDAANYRPVKSAVTSPQAFNTEATTLIGPNNQKFYHVVNGQLVADDVK